MPASKFLKPVIRKMKKGRNAHRSDVREIEARKPTSSLAPRAHPMERSLGKRQAWDIVDMETGESSLSATRRLTKRSSSLLLDKGITSSKPCTSTTSLSVLSFGTHSWWTRSRRTKRR